MPVVSRLHWTAILAVAALANSGCIAGIFVDTTLTTREFACAVLSDDAAETLILDVHVDESIDHSPLDAVGHLRRVLANTGDRTAASIEVRIAALSGPLEWGPDDWESELQDHRAREGLQGMRLTIYWVAAMAGNSTGEPLIPGVVGIDHGGLVDKASATGRTIDEVASAALLHHVGHALGTVNRGIPMQANHEGQPGHDASEDAVMHHAWHDALDGHWATNATYTNYSVNQQLDWRAALDNPQVCP